MLYSVALQYIAHIACTFGHIWGQAAGENHQPSSHQATKMDGAMDEVLWLCLYPNWILGSSCESQIRAEPPKQGSAMFQIISEWSTAVNGDSPRCGCRLFWDQWLGGLERHPNDSPRKPGMFRSRKVDSWYLFLDEEIQLAKCIKWQSQSKTRIFKHERVTCQVIHCPRIILLYGYSLGNLPNSHWDPFHWQAGGSIP